MVMYIVYVMCNYDLQSMTGMQHNIQFLHCDCEPLPLTFGVSKAMASNSSVSEICLYFQPS